MSKLDRLQKLKSAKTSITERHVKVSGLDAVVAELKAISEAQMATQTRLLDSVNALLTKIGSNAQIESKDTKALIKAVTDLKLEIAPNTPVDYELSGQRDKRGLIDLNSIKFTAVDSRTLN